MVEKLSGTAAGATVVDQQVATDGGFTTSRSPEDLPAFCGAIVDAFAPGPRQGEY
jgi:protease I